MGGVSSFNIGLIGDQVNMAALVEGGGLIRTVYIVVITNSVHYYLYMENFQYIRI